MNNYFIIGKVNEGKSHLFNLFSKDHKTISNPKENTTVDIIRKQIQHQRFNIQKSKFKIDNSTFNSLHFLERLKNKPSKDWILTN